MLPVGKPHNNQTNYTYKTTINIIISIITIQQQDLT